MPKSCSDLNGRIPSRQRFSSGRLACETVFAYGWLCNTTSIVQGLFMTNEWKEYIFRENVAIGMCVIDSETSVRNIRLHEHSERCNSQPNNYSNSRTKRSNVKHPRHCCLRMLNRSRNRTFRAKAKWDMIKMPPENMNSVLNVDDREYTRHQTCLMMPTTPAAIVGGYCGLSSLSARYTDALVSSVLFCFGGTGSKCD